MKPTDLYARLPEKVVQPFAEGAEHGPEYQMRYFIGSSYNHIGDDIDVWSLAGINISTRIEVRVYKDFNFDGRRFWRLASVWFDNTPVMILQNAGREGDDYVGRIITDDQYFTYMMRHIRSLFRYSADSEFVGDVHDPDEDYPALDNFYGNNLDGYFERY